MFKAKKYNFIVVCLILIISIVVGLSAGMGNISQNLDLLKPDAPHEVPDDLIIDDDIPEEELSNAPGPSAGAFERLAYAFDIMHNGAGFTSFYSQSIYTMGQEQKVALKRYRGGGLNLTEEWYATDFSVGKNEFKMFYSDGVNMKIKTIEGKTHQNYAKKEYNPSAGKITSLTVHEYVNVQERTPINNFFVTVNKDTAILDKYDTRSDKDNYIIRVKIPAEKIDKRYLNAFYANGATKIEYNYMLLTFKISKKTGYFTWYSKEEIFKGSYFGVPVFVEVKIVAVETIITMNRSAEDVIRQKVKAAFGI